MDYNETLVSTSNQQSFVLTWDNPVQEHSGLFFVQEPPPQVCSSRMTDTVLKKTKLSSYPYQTGFFQTFSGHIALKQRKKKTQHLHHFELY